MSDGEASPAASTGSLLRNLRTAAHIPPRQLAARAKAMWRRRRYAGSPRRPIADAADRAAGTCAADPLPQLSTGVLVPEGPDTVTERAEEFAEGRYRYLARTAELGLPVAWERVDESPLWVYQLQYLGAVRDLALAGRDEAASTLLCSWIVAHGDRWDRVAWHPYPVSLRIANVCQAAGALGSFDALGAGALASVATQAAFLLEHLEHDVRGNHLFENARALVHAGTHLSGELADRCLTTGRSLLAVEVPEQVLVDGGHFELAPLYHTIVMHGLLQIRALLGPGDELVRGTIGPALTRMAKWLAGVLCPDGDIPLLGDSARGFGPPPRALLELAGHVTSPARSRLTSFPATGLHVWRGLRVWGVLDAGPVCPTYLPAHGQADSLTVCVWVDGVPVVIDPGVYDYSGAERAWDRSSRAHSTLTVDDRDTSEVFGSFRVGGRAEVLAVAAQGEGVTASIRPFGDPARLTRTVRWGDVPGASFRIDDRASEAQGAVRSRLHLHPDVQLLGEPGGTSVDLRTARGTVTVTAAGPIRLEPGRSAPEFGIRRETCILVQDLAGEVGGELTGSWLLEPVAEA